MLMEVVMITSDTFKSIILLHSQNWLRYLHLIAFCWTCVCGYGPHLLGFFQQFHCHVTSTRSHLQDHICWPQGSLKKKKKKTTATTMDYKHWESWMPVCNLCLQDSCVSKTKKVHWVLSTRPHCNSTTFSMIPLTISGFFRMCWPMPVLNMIPVTDRTGTLSRTIYSKIAKTHFCPVYFLFKVKFLSHKQAYRQYTQYSSSQLCQISHYLRRCVFVVCVETLASVLSHCNVVNWNK